MPTRLFQYEAGWDLDGVGGTFARADAATCATYIDRNGVVRTVAANIPRDGHFISSVRNALLEVSRTNACTQSQEFDNASWTKTRASISADADTAPDGTTTADRVIEDSTAANSHVVGHGGITITADATITASCFLKAGTRTQARLNCSNGANSFSILVDLLAGTLSSPSTAGTGTYTRSSITALGDGWYRVSVTGTIGSGLTAVALNVLLASGGTTVYDGDGASYIRVWGAQLENSAAFATSYIATTSAAVTRAVDVLSYPIPSAMTTPAAMTIYLKFVERGTIFTTGARILQISESGDSVYSIRICENSANRYAVFLSDGASLTVSQSVHPTAVSIGDVVELRITVSSTGVVQLHQTLNGGAEVSATAGAAGGLPPTQWGSGTAKIWLGSRGGSIAGATALQSVRIASGAKTLAEMQALGSSFLVLGNMDFSVAVAGAAEGQADEIGSDSRAYAGNLRTTFRTRKRSYNFTSKTLTQSQYDDWVAAIEGTPVDWCHGAALNLLRRYRIKIVSSGYVPARGGVRRTLTINLRQV